MTPAEWAQLVPGVIALLGALTAVIRAEAAHRKLDDHVEFTHRVTSPIAQHRQSGTNGTGK